MKKESAVSVAALHQTSHAAFMPVEGQAMGCVVGHAPGAIGDTYLIEPSIKHAGFFFLSHLSDAGMRVDFLKRPIHSSLVEHWLQTEGLDPAGAPWHLHPCTGVEKAGQSLHPALEVA